MKKIELKSMTIQNFKGITSYSILFDGKNTTIYGDNDAGKTTIYDAFLWTLFHKDSKERMQFDWKPLDKDNQPIEGLQTSVKVTLVVDQQEITFEKIRVSKKVLKRKLERSVYEDISKYLIDGLETTTRQTFDKKVAEIITPDLFKRLSSITYFADQLLPKERREALFAYFGTKTDEEIMRETEALKPLIEIVGNDTIEDARSKVLQEQKRINETLKNIPVKIEGIQLAMPQIETLNRDDLTKQRFKLIQQKSDLADQLTTIKHSGAAAEYRSQLRVKQSELQEANLIHDNATQARINGVEEGKGKLFAELNELKVELQAINNQKSDLVTSLKNEQQELERLQEEYASLCKQYDDVEAQELFTPNFEPVPFDETKLACAYCGTEYKQEKKEELRAHHEAEEARRLAEYNLKCEAEKEAFISTKETTLDEIRTRGQENNRYTAETEERIKDLTEQLNDDKRFDTASLEAKISEKEAALETIKNQIDELLTKCTLFEETQKHADIQKEIDFLIKAVHQTESTMSEQIQVQEGKITEVDQKIQAIDQQLALFTEFDRQQSVIETLTDQERELSAQKGEILEQLALFEEFYITKRDLLQDHINSHFSLVEWKLFDFYEEGGLNESICEPMINGIPYRSLNTGSQMQAGLDVANTMMKQAGILVPIFIDNAEAMTTHKLDEVQVDTQLIGFYVSENDKNLRIEREEES